MRNNKLITTVFIFLLSLMTSLSVNAAPANNPISLLQFIANNMIAGLKTNKATLKTKPQVVYNLAYRYVVPYADLSEMSKRVLPPQIWNSASASERQKFQKQFTMTLIRTYASALTSYQDQVIKFYPIRGGLNSNNVEVSSEIDSAENEPIHVTYRLLRINGSWKLYDMSVEGVSMLESFRSQFSDILSSGSMQELLQRMSAHNAG